jgi:hypothetical protein
MNFFLSRDDRQDKYIISAAICPKFNLELGVTTISGKVHVSVCFTTPASGLNFLRRFGSCNHHADLTYDIFINKINPIYTSERPILSFNDFPETHRHTHIIDLGRGLTLLNMFLSTHKHTYVVDF